MKTAGDMVKYLPFLLLVLFGHVLRPLETTDVGTVGLNLLFPLK